MIRERLVENQIGSKTDFRWRGHEISRMEGLSDGVFAFAVTLLVVSLEVPKTFTELSATMRGFGAFAISAALLFMIWFNQYKFFRRYGLQDTFTIVLNAVLLFVVLFYVYPLKFLFTYLVSMLTGGHGEVRLPNGNVEAMVEGKEMVTLMLIFGAGYVAVFAVFFLLYLHAYRKRRQLELNDLEVFDTRDSMQESLLNCAVGSLSIAIAFFGGRYALWAGPVYMLVGVILTVHGTIMGKQRRKLEQLATQPMELGS
ncbi:MAG TPA: TMEM175 family protein [Pyrinomonadaceae bacterium]|nr:TMEM175 family protein [Pyrinomonadaceae bacterium]